MLSLVREERMPNTSIKGELIEFPTPDGFLLHGFLIGDGTRTCTICLHGMTSNFYSATATRRNAAIAKKLAGKGSSVFAINTRGHDFVSSLHYKKPGRWGKIVGTNYERFEECVYDIQGALNEMKKRGFSKFVLVGHSTGCQKVMYYQYRKNNKDVVGLVLLAPGDDYNLNKKALGKKFGVIVKLCRRMVKHRQGMETNKVIPRGFSAKRFLSFADLKNVEARLFDYEGELREFSKIKTPVCVIFGSLDKSRLEPVRSYMKILEKKTASRFFMHKIVNGAGHTFKNHESDVAGIVSDFVLRIQKAK